jgi:hypothetical protein
MELVDILFSTSRHMVADFCGIGANSVILVGIMYDVNKVNKIRTKGDLTG